MLDPTLDRTLSWQLSIVHDLHGRRRPTRRGIRGGTWFLDPANLDGDDDDVSEAKDGETARAVTLEAIRSCGLFTPLEVATIDALAIERLTLAEIAARDGCSRQAVMARFAGNSKGQGGILKKIERLRAHGVPTERLLPRATRSR